MHGQGVQDWEQPNALRSWDVTLCSEELDAVFLESSQPLNILLLFLVNIATFMNLCNVHSHFTLKRIIAKTLRLIQKQDKPV